MVQGTHSKEARNKISKGLKKYFSNLTKEERSKLYNTTACGLKHPRSKPIGSSYIQKHGGYRMIKVLSGDWVPEHKLVVEEYIGRKLNKGEVIHHINEDRLDNRPENLYVFEKRGLHTSFTQLVKYNIISLEILESNLNKLKRN